MGQLISGFWNKSATKRGGGRRTGWNRFTLLPETTTKTRQHVRNSGSQHIKHQAIKHVIQRDRKQNR